MRLWLIALALIWTAGTAAAQPVGERAARGMLYPVRGYEVRLAAGLSETEAATLRAIVPLMAEQLRQPVRYYGAIVWSPDDGLVHESLQAAMNFHAPDAAAVAAVRACEPKRSRGGRDCAVAALIVPKGWRPDGVMLSVDATAAFERGYRRARSPKAFAISRETGAFGWADGEPKALDACGAADCAIVIRD